MPERMRIAAEVRTALERGGAVVALESTVVAHGLPRPENLALGRALEQEVRERAATPATVAVLDGIPVVGLGDAELERIATQDGVEKLSTRDLPVAAARGGTGATTVAATAWLAAASGIEVFATGGIGGVHRGLPPDLSADLMELGRTTLLVVCSGAKSILDLPATREALESLGVLVLGWRTDALPAFYAGMSELDVDARVESAVEVAAIWQAHRKLGAPGSVLLCVPAPASEGLDAAALQGAVEEALRSAGGKGVRGKALTPYLLQEVARITEGRSVRANVALLRNNAAVAARVGSALARENR